MKFQVAISTEYYYDNTNEYLNTKVPRLKWLKERGIHYDVTFIPESWYFGGSTPRQSFVGIDIDIPNDSDAMMFKLAWEGMPHAYDIFK